MDQNQINILGSLLEEAPTLASVGLFLWYLLRRDAEMQKRHTSYFAHLESINERAAAVHREATEAIQKNTHALGENAELHRSLLSVVEELKAS